MPDSIETDAPGAPGAPGDPDAPEGEDKATPGKSPYVISRGIKFPKDGNFITGQVRGALRRNAYERKESDAALRLVREGDVVLELGAGIGYMSSLIASKCKVAAVHAFEANPELIPYIRSVHAANGLSNAFVHHAVLGARKGTTTFHVRRNFIASSLSDVDGSDVLRSEEIEVLNANTVMREVKPTVLICDIEGAEAELFAAMKLDGLRAALIELHPQWIGQQGVRAVFDAMHNAGLTYWPKASERKVVAFAREF